MPHIVRALCAFARDDEGATAVEYALMLAFIAAVIFAAVDALGKKVDGIFTDMDARWP